jgi:hypothetical protein
MEQEIEISEIHLSEIFEKRGVYALFFQKDHERKMTDSVVSQLMKSRGNGSICAKKEKIFDIYSDTDIDNERIYTRYSPGVKARILHPNTFIIFDSVYLNKTMTEDILKTCEKMNIDVVYKNVSIFEKDNLTVLIKGVPENTENIYNTFLSDVEGFSLEHFKDVIEQLEEDIFVIKITEDNIEFFTAYV